MADCRIRGWCVGNAFCTQWITDWGWICVRCRGWENSISVALGLLGPRNSLTPHTGVSLQAFIVLVSSRKAIKGSPISFFFIFRYLVQIRPLLHPHPKVECFCEFFCKQKWHKAEYSPISESSRFATLLLGKTSISVFSYQAKEIRRGFSLLREEPFLFSVDLS